MPMEFFLDGAGAARGTNASVFAAPFILVREALVILNTHLFYAGAPSVKIDRTFLTVELCIIDGDNDNRVSFERRSVSWGAPWRESHVSLPTP